jgi:hypothetical protein
MSHNDAEQLSPEQQALAKVVAEYRADHTLPPEFADPDFEPSEAEAIVIGVLEGADIETANAFLALNARFEPVEDPYGTVPIPTLIDALVRAVEHQAKADDRDWNERLLQYKPTRETREAGLTTIPEALAAIDTLQKFKSQLDDEWYAGPGSGPGYDLEPWYPVPPEGDYDAALDTIREAVEHRRQLGIERLGRLRLSQKVNTTLAALRDLVAQLPKGRRSDIKKLAEAIFGETLGEYDIRDARRTIRKTGRQP